MRSCILSGMPTHLVQELNVGTVGQPGCGGSPCMWVIVHCVATCRRSVRFHENDLASSCMSLSTTSINIIRNKSVAHGFLISNDNRRDSLYCAAITIELDRLPADY